MLGEESMIISGLLVGLNVIDCSFSIKDEDLDQPVRPLYSTSLNGGSE